MVTHGLSSRNPNQNYWPLKKETIREVMEIATKKFPNTPIIPTIGNNDLMYHYQAPNTTDKQMFYSDLKNLWFDQVKAN